MPYITKVIGGKLPHLNVYGNDYDTRDGTGERDYIHVMDLAALNYLQNNAGAHIHNLGTGQGTTVLELINAFQRINQIEILHQFSDRRDGDLPSYYADASKALKDLGWQAKRSLEQSCKDTFHQLVISNNKRK